LQLTEGRLLLSATDLVGELACEHLTTLELEAARGERERPFRHDDQLELIEQRGLEHEQAYLSRFPAGSRVVNLEDLPRRSAGDLAAAHAATLRALQGGADVVYQGTLFDGRFRGHPDFLLRVEEPSALGGWSYEVADAKLARHVRAGAIVQCCVYSELLARAQERVPGHFHVVTGDGVSHRHRLADYSAWFRATQRQFEERLASAGPETYPDPVDHCRVCRWYGQCQDRRRKDDHLSRVAGLSRAHAMALVRGGVPTLTALGTGMAPGPIQEIATPTVERLRQQARLQLAQYADGRVRHELVAPDSEEKGRGLERLPEPASLDVFLDFESHPWACEGGLEYLMGTVVEEGGAAVYAARWAASLDGEKRAFESLVDFVMERLRHDPRMHVYHYGAYERGALRRLMGRHATREEEVDALLRGETLVDLFEVVRQGVSVSQESYSLKKVEKLYMPRREGPSTEPGFAVVEYERWLRTQASGIQEAIEAYNRDDCLSTWRLRAWLEARRPEAEKQFALLLGRPGPKNPDASEAVKRSVLATRRRVAALLALLPADPAQRTEDEQGLWLLAQLLDWHRREERPGWWSYFDLKERPLEELVQERGALGALSYAGELRREARSIVHRYRYDPRQEHKFHEFDKPHDPFTASGAGTVVSVDPDEGLIDLKRAASSIAPHPRGLIAPGPPNPAPMRDGLARVADHVLAHGLRESGPYRAALDLLLRRPPATRDLALGIATCLAIQGPPGTGKTYTGARMIVALVKAGRRVGIVATSHKAVTNLVEAACDAAAAAELELRVVHKADEDAVATRSSVRIVADNKDVLKALDTGRCDVVAGTPWLFARAEMEGRVEVLFVDEAGQMSLASVIAMGGAGRSIVLLGDPNQLAQVSQGTHPPGAEVSALEHVLGGAPTLTEERGVFLPETRRLHPDVCAFISEAFYENRLRAHASTRGQRIAPGPLVSGTGLRLVGVAHRGNTARSREEADRVADLVAALVGRDWTNQGARHPPWVSMTS
jgi:predicted RecB family nuclease